MVKYAGLELLEIYTEWKDKDYSDGSSVWKDSVLVVRKPLVMQSEK